jgi:hypothetical protein
MRKAIIIIILAFSGIAGYFYYDWHVKTQRLAAAPSISFFSWTDKNGNKHFTNTQPPVGAKNVKESKGYEYIEQPIVLKIKYKAIELYKKIKIKHFRKQDE